MSKQGEKIMLELYMYWASEFRLFMIQEPLMFTWFIVTMTLAIEGLIESIQNFNN